MFTEHFIIHALYSVLFSKEANIPMESAQEPWLVRESATSCVPRIRGHLYTPYQHLLVCRIVHPDTPLPKLPIYFSSTVLHLPLFFFSKLK